LWVFLASYLVFAAVTWLVYLRTASSYAQRPALAGGAV
jgi:hypothetical protein